MGAWTSQLMQWMFQLIEFPTVMTDFKPFLISPEGIDTLFPFTPNYIPLCNLDLDNLPVAPCIIFKQVLHLYAH